MAYYAPMAKPDTAASLASRLPGGVRLHAAALAVGLFAAPPLIWLTGRGLFGPYANGGVFSLWGDFFGLLARGSVAAWTVALAPLALLLIFRAALAISRRVG
jgi:hypothetical protein